MAGHIVTSYDEELVNLADSVSEIGWRADYMMENGVGALLRADKGLARQVIAADVEVNALQRVLEDRAISVIARRQPVAQDLREIIAAIRIANELERIADLGKNIARRTLALDSRPIRLDLVHGVEQLAKLGRHQLDRILDSYAARDVAAAQRIWRDDDEVDGVYVSLFSDLVAAMIEDPRRIGMCTHLLFCAKNIERLGDHVTNIAEMVHYLVTGEPLEAHAEVPLAGS